MTNTSGFQWSNYWSAGYLTSLPSDFRENYDGEIKAFWDKLFSNLADEAVILDVCAGNGAIALLAAEYADVHDKGFTIIATDGAKIDPALITQRFPNLGKRLSRIQVIDQTTLEELTLEPSSVDLITSQYGVEYCDWPVVAERFATWLKPNGRLAIVAHSRDTDIIAQMKNEYKEYQILDSTHFFKRAKKVLRHNPAQKELQSLLQPVGEELSRSLLTRVSPLLKPMMEAAQFVFNAPPELYRQQKTAIIGFLNNVLHARMRLENLLEVHKRIDTHDNWYETFATGGVTLERDGKLVYKQKYPAGDYYIFAKQ